MVRAVGGDAPEQKVIDDIAKFGWHCVHILAESESGPYSFTVGVQHTYKHPEFIIFGLPSNVAHEVLQLAVEAVQRGQPLDLAAPTDELLEGYPCVFVQVPVAAYQENVGFCRWYYEGNGFVMHQIVWPNRAGHFPWHPEASASFRSNQPVLGYASQGT
jgi:hypothetical protein